MEKNSEKAKDEAKLDAADVGLIIWLVVIVGLLGFIWAEVSDLKRQVSELRPKPVYDWKTMSCNPWGWGWYGDLYIQEYIKKPHCGVCECCSGGKK